MKNWWLIAFKVGSYFNENVYNQLIYTLSCLSTIKYSIKRISVNISVMSCQNKFAASFLFTDVSSLMFEHQRWIWWWMYVFIVNVVILFVFSCKVKATLEWVLLLLCLFSICFECSWVQKYWLFTWKSEDVITNSGTRNKYFV